MEQNLENNDWRKEAPLLASLPFVNPFIVPEGYFEGLGDEISNAISLEGLKAKVSKTGFATPDNYFEELNDKINTSIFAEKLKAAVTEDGFKTPSNYFEQLQSNILAKTTMGQTAAKPEPEILRLWHSKIVKYASAACFVIVAGLGTFYLNNAEPESQLIASEVLAEQILYDIDEELIIEHLKANDIKQPKVSESDAAMESYILNNYSQNEIAGL